MNDVGTQSVGCSKHLEGSLMKPLYIKTSLVPRPHPLTRRNGLVNQVEFLGLAHAFATT